MGYNIKDLQLSLFKRFTPYLILCLFVFSCKNNPHDVDISAIEVEVELKRFEKDLFNTVEYEKLNVQYGYFFQVFAENMLNLSYSSPLIVSNGLKDFCSDQEIKSIYSDVENTYGDFSSEMDKITKALRYYNFHFPNKPVPNIVTFISGFNYGIVSLDSTIGIGLDMFLGEDYEYYKALQFPLYKRSKLQRKHIPISALKGWVETEYTVESNNQSCLSRMVEKGKVLYALDALFPMAADSMKIQYNPAQMEWAEINEVFVWATLVDQKLLYEKNFSKTYKLFNDGPFTSLFEQTSAPRIGEYIGWQIVRSFMENNDVTLDSLMNINNAQTLLANSNYKPKR